MKSLTDRYQLHNGVAIPCIGFGTWQMPDDETGIAAVKTALSAGYRHIDTAAIYGNEKSVGAAVKQSGIARKEIFVTSKLWNDDHGYENTLAAFERTMEDLSMDYLDLYLIHWPNPIKYRDRWQEANAGSWRAMEELYAAGRIRAIGLSNFLPHHIDALMETAKVAPMVNQIRICPGDTKAELVAYCHDRRMLIEAYSPLGTGRIFDVPGLKALAQKYRKTVPQIAIRWSLQKGYLPLPKSVTPRYIRENADVFDFELSDEDMRIITGLECECGSSSDPDKAMF